MHTCIQTERQTDRQTDIHISIDVYIYIYVCVGVRACIYYLYVAYELGALLRQVHVCRHTYMLALFVVHLAACLLACMYLFGWMLSTESHLHASAHMPHDSGLHPRIQIEGLWEPGITR